MIRILTIAIISICITPFVSNAQWQMWTRAALDDGEQKWHSPSRWELCFSYSLSPVFIETQYQIYDTTTKIAKINKPKSYSLSNTGSFGGGIGISFPLVTGKTTGLAISCAYMAMFYNFKVKDSIPVTQHTSIKESMQYMSMYLPVSLDFKVGGDAVYNRDIKYMVTLGAGAMPFFYGTPTYGSDLSIGDDEANVGIKAFGKAELGFFAGIAMKLRATCSFKKILFDEQNTYEEVPDKSTQLGYVNITGHYKVTTNPELTLSLVLMPFSRKWDSDR